MVKSTISNDIFLWKESKCTISEFRPNSVKYVCVRINSSARGYDILPLDCYLEHSKNRAYDKNQFSNKAAPIARIHKVCKAMEPEMLDKACQTYVSQV